MNQPALSASRRPHFHPIHLALVPIFAGDEHAGVLEAALQVAENVLIVGFVCVPDTRALSSGAAAAREMRQRLADLAATSGAISDAQVLVTASPWSDLVRVATELQPDLLLLDWEKHPAVLGIAPAAMLEAPPCNIALLNGCCPRPVNRVLMPIRGGPHANLVVRMGLSFNAAANTALHVRLPEPASVSDAPFRGLERVLPQLHNVDVRFATTSDPAAHILQEGADFDMIIMGATTNPSAEHASLGPVVDRVLHESRVPVIVVRVAALAAESPVQPEYSEVADEMAGSRAISILVDKWFSENTFHADEFADLERLIERKQQQGLTISLALPALNEEATVGNVITTIKRALMEEAPLVDEIVLIDSNSTDRTCEIARDLGVPVFVHQQLLPQMGPRRGKGEALWKSLLVTRGELVAWIDTDIVNIHPRFVYGLLGPLIANPSIHYVKGFYQRPLKVGEALGPGGGRVTELTARPLLNLFFPELSGVIQPLAGEYAGRRSTLERLRFFSGYGVETGLLIDFFEVYGLGSIAQVDLLERIHSSQALDALSRMSFAILQVFLNRLGERLGTSLLADVNRTMKIIRYAADGYTLDVEEIAEHERPPMITLDEYVRSRRPAGTPRPSTPPPASDPPPARLAPAANAGRQNHSDALDQTAPSSSSRDAGS